MHDFIIYIYIYIYIYLCFSIITYCDLFLIMSITSEDIKKCVTNKLINDFTNMFFHHWSYFASFYNLSSSDTCIYGSYITYAIHAEQQRSDLTNNSLFVDFTNTSVDIFFYHTGYRKLFLLYLQNVFSVQYTNNDNDDQHVDNLTVLLQPNFQGIGPVIQIKVNIVCKITGIPFLGYCNVHNLQISPCGIIEVFGHYDKQFPREQMHVLGTTIQIIDTFNLIFKHECSLCVLSYDAFISTQEIFPSEEESLRLYEQYWSYIFHVRLPYLLFNGWKIQNVNVESLCKCDNPALTISEKSIVNTCSKCEHAECVFSDFQN
jgi:hypothetical protein